MHTIAFLTKRVPGMSRDAFFEHYRTTHYGLSTQLPGLISYQQAEIAADDGAWPAATAVSGYDALSIYTFESKEAADAAFAAPEGVATNEDTPLFMEWSSIIGIPTTVIQRFEAKTGGQTDE